jgi:hypothetical protein
MNSKNSSISFYVTITIATTAVACLVLLPRETRAFAPTFQRRWNRHQTKPSSMTSSTTSTLSTDENQHESNGMPILPSDVVQYTQVPKVCTKFTATTIPSGLLKEHTTKKGTCLCVDCCSHLHCLMMIKDNTHYGMMMISYTLVYLLLHPSLQEHGASSVYPKDNSNTQSLNLSKAHTLSTALHWESLNQPNCTVLKH